MDMLYKSKEAFSLRDEVGTCPNIEVEIDVTDVVSTIETHKCRLARFTKFI